MNDQFPQNAQMQITAMRQFYERQISHVTAEGANIAAQCEDFAQQIVALKARVAELELPKAALHHEGEAA